MTKHKTRYLVLGILGAVLTVLLAVSLACGAEETPTPVPTVTPAPTAVPTAVPAPTVVPIHTAVPTTAPVTGPQYGGDLRYAYNLNISTMDTHYSKQVEDRPVYYALYNTLVQYGTDFSIYPELATSWEVAANGKDVTFHLAEGVKFHNGEEFNAQTVKWNFDRRLRTEDPVRLHSMIAVYMDRVSVVDDHTVTFVMKYPYRPLLSDLGERPGFMLPPMAVEEMGGGYALDGGEFTRHGIGTGPFKWGEWTVGQQMVLERNNNYWENGKPYLDRIIFQHAPDRQIRLALLRTGETDVIDDVRVQDTPLIEANPNIRFTSLATGRWNCVTMSVDREPWSNKDIRMAIALAIDREALAATYYGGAAVPAYSSEGGNWAFDSTIKAYEYNPQRAREYLAKAGYPNGITMSYWCEGTPAEIELCEIYQAMMADVGINLNIVTVPPGEVWTMAIEGKAPFSSGSFRARADPHARLFRVFHTTGPSNVFGYSNPEVDRLLEEAVKVYDIEKAKPLYSQIQRIVSEEPAHRIFTVFELWYAGINARVQDFELYPDQMQRLRDLWIKE